MSDRKKTTERRRNIVVGITSLVGLFGFVILLTAFGYLPAFLNQGYHVTVYMDNVAGLSENSKVTLWGRMVGEVTEVGFAGPGEPNRAFVKLKIEDEFDVPEDVTVRIETPLFGGGPMIALVNSGPGAKPLARDGSATLTSGRVIDPLMQLEVVSEDIAELKRTWVDVGENINTLFGSEDDDALPSLPRVVQGLEDRLGDLQRVFAGAEAWLADESLRENVVQTAENAKAITETLGETVSSLEARYLALADSAETRLAKVDQTIDASIKTLDTASGSIAEIETRYVALADDAAKVVSVIDKLVARADSKDSTVGLLLNDPQLYLNLTDTSERLKLMTDEARLLIEKWKAEGLPIRVFN
ncbi:MAG: MlaD family protein [Phycisphaeraceae bacterium]